jgi:hypothetical protein
VRISEEEDGSLRVENRRTAARALIGLAGSLEHPALEDLAADRQLQAAAEKDDAMRSRRSVSATASNVRQP